MKRISGKIVAAVLVVAALAGCATTNQESAYDWLQRQTNSQTP